MKTDSLIVQFLEIVRLMLQLGLATRNTSVLAYGNVDNGSHG